jgi:hypothetical protein
MTSSHAHKYILLLHASMTAEVLIHPPPTAQPALPTIQYCNMFSIHRQCTLRFCNWMGPTIFHTNLFELLVHFSKLIIYRFSHAEVVIPIVRVSKDNIPKWIKLMHINWIVVYLHNSQPENTKAYRTLMKT